MSKIKLKNLDIVYQLRRTNSNKLSLFVYPSGDILVKAPYYYPKILITKFLERKSVWIKKKLDFWQNNDLKAISQKTRQDYLGDKEKARKLIVKRLEFLNQYYNFKYNSVKIKNQKTTWGSCSKKLNLNFNFRLLYLPEKVRDYIIVHELCHLKELNHSAKFWNLVSLTVPDYREIRKQLKKGRFN